MILSYQKNYPRFFISLSVLLLITALLPYIDLALSHSWIFNEYGDKLIQRALGLAGHSWDGPPIEGLSSSEDQVMLPGPWYQELLKFGINITGSGHASLFYFQLTSILIGTVFLSATVHRLAGIKAAIVCSTIYLSFYMNPIAIANSWNGAATPVFVLGGVFFIDRAMYGCSRTNFFISSMFLATATQMHLFGLFAVIPLIAALVVTKYKASNVILCILGFLIVNSVYIFSDYLSGFANTRAFSSYVYDLIFNYKISETNSVTSLTILLKLIVGWDIFTNVHAKIALSTLISTTFMMGVLISFLRHNKSALVIFTLFIGQSMAISFTDFSVAGYGSFYTSVLISASVAAFISIGIIEVIGSTLLGMFVSLSLTLCLLYGAINMPYTKYQEQDTAYGLRGIEIEKLEAFAESEGISFTALLKNTVIIPVKGNQQNLTNNRRASSLYSLIDRRDESSSAHCYELRYGIIKDSDSRDSFIGTQISTNMWFLVPNSHSSIMSISAGQKSDAGCSSNTINQIIQ